MVRGCNLEIVTGFLGWGKTSFIKSYMEMTSKWDDNTVILQFENGREKFDDEFLKRRNISLKTFKSLNDIDENRIKRILDYYEPRRIIAELNCMDNINKASEKFGHRKLSRRIKIIDSIAVIDVMTVQVFMKNMISIIQPNIMSADLIILNNCDKVSSKQKEEVRKTMENLNNHAHIVESVCQGEYKELKESPLIRSVWR